MNQYIFLFSPWTFWIIHISIAFVVYARIEIVDEYEKIESQQIHMNQGEESNNLLEDYTQTLNFRFISVASYHRFMVFFYKNWLPLFIYLARNFDRRGTTWVWTYFILLEY